MKKLAFGLALLATAALLWAGNIDNGATRNWVSQWISGFMVAPVTWNADQQVPEVTMPDGTVGQMFNEVYVIIRNTNSFTITNGLVVRACFANGYYSGACLASANDTFRETLTILGVATVDIPQNSQGKITVLGQVNDLNTSMFNEGSNLWLSATAGQMTMTEPSTTNLQRVLIANCLRSNPSQGRIQVHVSLVPRLDDLLGTAANASVLNGRATITNNVIKFTATAATQFGMESTVYPVSNQVSSAWLGYAALYEAAGTANVAVGQSALSSAPGSYNTAVGASALASAPGSYNTAIGRAALNGSLGSGNSAIGESAANFMEGSSNVAIGIGSADTAVGNYNVTIGSSAGVALSGQSNLVLGAFAARYGTETVMTNAIVIGAGIQAKGNNTVAIGTPAATIYIDGWLITSNNVTVASGNVIQRTGGWDDLNFPAVESARVGVDDIEFDSVSNGLIFKTSCTTNFTDDHELRAVHFPHSWATNTAVYPHIHFLQTNADQTNMFFLRRKWYDNGGAFPAAWTDEGYATNIFAYTSGTMLQIATWPVIQENHGISSIMDVKIYRNGSVGTGPILEKQFDVHVQHNSFGSDMTWMKSF